MANTNWNNIISNSLKGAIAVVLATISGCVVPVSWKAYKVLNNVQSVTTDVKNVTKTVKDRINDVSPDDIQEIMSSVNSLITALNKTAVESLPAIQNALVRLVDSKNINRVLNALENGYVQKLIDIIIKCPNIIQKIDGMVGPSGPSIVETLTDIAKQRNIELPVSDASEGANSTDTEKKKTGLFEQLRTRLNKLTSRKSKD